MKFESRVILLLGLFVGVAILAELPKADDKIVCFSVGKVTEKDFGDNGLESMRYSSDFVFETKRLLEAVEKVEKKTMKDESSAPSNSVETKTEENESSAPSNSIEKKTIKDESSAPSNSIEKKTIKDESSAPSNSVENKTEENESSFPSNSVENKTEENESSFPSNSVEKKEEIPVKKEGKEKNEKKPSEKTTTSHEIVLTKIKDSKDTFKIKEVPTSDLAAVITITDKKLSTKQKNELCLAMFTKICLKSSSKCQKVSELKFTQTENGFQPIENQKKTIRPLATKRPENSLKPVLILFFICFLSAAGLVALSKWYKKEFTLKKQAPFNPPTWAPNWLFPRDPFYYEQELVTPVIDDYHGF